MARRAAYRKRRQNRFGMFLAYIVVIMLLIVVAFDSIQLKAKKDMYRQKEASLETQIEAEQKRAQEIDEFEKYTHTKNMWRRWPGINLDWFMKAKSSLKMRIKAGIACFFVSF